MSLIDDLKALQDTWTTLADTRVYPDGTTLANTRVYPYGHLFRPWAQDAYRECATAVEALLQRYAGEQETDYDRMQCEHPELLKMADAFTQTYESADAAVYRNASDAAREMGDREHIRELLQIIGSLVEQRQATGVVVSVPDSAMEADPVEVICIKNRELRRIELRVQTGEP